MEKVECLTTEKCHQDNTLQQHKRQYLTTAQKWQCIGMLQARESQNHVARFLGKWKIVISRLAALYSQTGDVKMRTGHGWHRETNVRQDRFIRVIALHKWFVTAPELKQEHHTATGL